MSIVVSNLAKHYGKQKAVDKITFTAKPGRILGFLGPNGAGKSTTMKMLTGYLTPTAGEIHICGKNIAQDPIAIKNEIGYLPENTPLYTEMYVREFLSFVAQTYALKDVAQRVDEVIKQVGLTREQHKKIGMLSKGYKQRVGLAQAIIHQPKVLILDEPTSGLDPNQLSDIRSLIKNLGAEKTVVISTHIMQEVEALCDDIIIIDRGILVANATIADLKAQFPTKNLDEIFKSLTRSS